MFTNCPHAPTDRVRRCSHRFNFNAVDIELDPLNAEIVGHINLYHHLLPAVPAQDLVGLGQQYLDVWWLVVHRNMDGMG